MSSLSRTTKDLASSLYFFEHADNAEPGIIEILDGEPPKHEMMRGNNLKGEGFYLEQRFPNCFDHVIFRADPDASSVKLNTFFVCIKVERR